MNLVMVSVLLLAMLACQPTLIYGTKGSSSLLATHTASASNSNSKSHKNGNGKKHSAHIGSGAKSAPAAKLLMSLESGDVLVRAARMATDMTAVEPETAASNSNASSVGGIAGTSTGRRAKHNNNNNNNKKLNKNQGTAENASNAGRNKHMDKKFSAAANQDQQQQQHQHHRNGNNNNRGKQHQNHGVRNGGSKIKAENVDKTVGVEKSQSTCRYAKSAWSECDVKTNMRTRTLTLKKGEANCLHTRTMQKKCRKSCRYEKGSWSECSSGQMTRQDKLKSTGNAATDSSCEPVRTINKKCNPGSGSKQQGGNGGGGKANKERKNKDKASRRAQQQQAA